METLVDDKLVENIGVSNFNKKQMERLLQNCRIKPSNSQVGWVMLIKTVEVVHLVAIASRIVECNIPVTLKQCDIIGFLHCGILP